MILVHMEGDSWMLYKFFILHDTLALETALRIFCRLCKNVEFVQMKQEGKRRKLSELIFAKYAGAQD